MPSVLRVYRECATIAQTDGRMVIDGPLYTTRRFYATVGSVVLRLASTKEKFPELVASLLTRNSS